MIVVWLRDLNSPSPDAPSYRMALPLLSRLATITAVTRAATGAPTRSQCQLIVPVMIEGCNVSCWGNYLRSATVGPPLCASPDIYSPGSAPAAISVGSSNRDDSLSSFSNVGGCVFTFGPGKQPQPSTR